MTNRPLLIAFIVTAVLLFLPGAAILTYPFLIFSTFIHEASHAAAALLTFGRVDSITVSPDGSGLTYTAGGIRMIVASAGYVGTALFGGLLIVLSSHLRWVKGVLVFCAALIAIVTAAFIGHSNHLVVLGSLGVSIALILLRKRMLMLIAGALILLLGIYLAATGSLFSWIVGIALTLALVAVVRFASPEAAHVFLAFLAVQCSLNSLVALRTLMSLSVRGDYATDAQTLHSLTGLPASFWAIVWSIQAIVILALALWVKGRIHRRDAKVQV
jgi:peptidase M50B-like protein